MEYPLEGEPGFERKRTRPTETVNVPEGVGNDKNDTITLVNSLEGPSDNCTNDSNTPQMAAASGSAASTSSTTNGNTGITGFGASSSTNFLIKSGFVEKSSKSKDKMKEILAKKLEELKQLKKEQKKEQKKSEQKKSKKTAKNYYEDVHRWYNYAVGYENVNVAIALMLEKAEKRTTSDDFDPTVTSSTRVS
jgi:hypothetical protein